MRNNLLRTKSSILIALLALLGFTACGDNDDPQPEYGVRIVRDKQVIQEQLKNDSIVRNQQIIENNR
jgi:hypothetical protein